VFEALVEGLGLIFQGHVLVYFALGCVLGILMGAVPGMGGAIGLVLLLPFTFSMEPVAAFALLLASWASAASQATVLDGYPMAKRGEAARALGAAFTSSAIGGVCGAAALGISLPLILPIILAFESPEQFMLGMLGLAMVGSLSGQSISDRSRDNRLQKVSRPLCLVCCWRPSACLSRKRSLGTPSAHCTYWTNCH